MDKLGNGTYRKSDFETTKKFISEVWAMNKTVHPRSPRTNRPKQPPR